MNRFAAVWLVKADLLIDLLRAHRRPAFPAPSE
jgi:hypothetical protein